MNILNSLLYSKLYSEEGGEAPTGGEGDAHAAGGGENNEGGDPTTNDNGEHIIKGGENGDGVELLAGKYKTPEELEKGYKEAVTMHTKTAEKAKAMEDKLKGFAGAPEGDYDGIEGFEGYSSPVMDALGSWGKDQGLTQEGYSELLTTIRSAEAENAKAHQEAEMGKLGSDAQIRIDNTNAKLTAIFGEDLAAQYQNIGTSADGVMALEALVAKFGEGKVNPDSGDFVGEDPISQDDLSTAMNKKDSAGMPLMQTSPEYAKQVYAQIEKYNKQHGVS